MPASRGVNTRRVPKPALCGLLLADVLSPTGGVSSPAPPDVIVNEIYYRGAEVDLEYIELYNRSSQTVDLARLAFSDDRRQPVELSTRSLILGAGEYAVFVRDTTTFDKRFDGVERNFLRRWPALNNGGDTVILWEGAEVVDSVRFAPSWGGNGVALERIDPSAPSDASTNWTESVNRDGGTPGRRNSVFAPDREPPTPYFCEQHSDGRLLIYFTEPLDARSTTSADIRLESGVRPAEVWLEQSGQVLSVRAPDGDPSRWIDIKGALDLSGNAAESARIEIAWLPNSGEILINEIMFEPLADAFDGRPNQSEYVELLVRTERTLTLRGLALTGPLRENGVRDSITVTDRRLAVHDGMFVLVYARPETGSDPLDAFPRITRTDPGVLFVEIARPSLSLGNNGDTARLDRSHGPAQAIDEVQYRPSWHLPERIATRGIALERITSAGPSNHPSNWSSSIASEGGTPGRANSVALHSVATDRGALLSVQPSPFSPNGDGYEDVTSLSVSSARPTGLLRAWIFDLDGNLVRELLQAEPVGRSSTWIWDGRDDQGATAARGVYVILVEVVDTRSGYVERAKEPVALY